MSDLPLVSVVIPFFNGARFFQEAVESVRRQSYTHWELLLVDDGSTDDSTAIAKQHAAADPDRVRYVEHPNHANRGASSSRNLGSRMARGEYVAFLDADDVWLPHKLEQQVAILEAKPDVGMVYGRGMAWYGWTGLAEDAAKDALQDLGSLVGTTVGYADLLAQYLTEEGTVPSSFAIMARRRLLDAVGGASEENWRSVYDDQVAFTKLALLAPVYISGECWYWYRQHPDSRCADMARTGEYYDIRVPFLEWQRDYLALHGGTDTRLNAVLDIELGISYLGTGRIDAGVAPIAAAAERGLLGPRELDKLGQAILHGATNATTDAPATFVRDIFDRLPPSPALRRLRRTLVMRAAARGLRQTSRRLSEDWRSVPRGVLDAVGLLRVAQRTENALRRLRQGPNAPERWVTERFERFQRNYKALFAPGSSRVPASRGTALIISIGFPQVEFELWLVKALEQAGYSPAAILLEDWNASTAQAYYEMAGVTGVRTWATFLPPVDLPAAEAVVNGARSLADLVAFEHRGARCGRFALATAIRRHRLQSLDLTSAEHRTIITRFLAESMAAAEAGERILRDVSPSLVLFVDRVYSPSGEFLDLCSSAGVTTVRWDKGHRNNAIVFKRYTAANVDDHPESLSEETWRRLEQIDWPEERTAELNQELYNCYTTGDWYSQCATQYNKRLLTPSELRVRLRLDPAKKTAIIFPHILWDSSFFFGEDLFTNYEEWLIAAVRAASANPNVNWVLKIHPAHVGKDVAEGVSGDPAEVVALRKHIGELPPHITVLHPSTDINTFSLFEIMDYCLTVRGTVGIESARLGIPVLTAGTGRYDRRGFTIDSSSTEEYLDRIARIQDIPRLTRAQQEAADRFAYALFILRQFPLTSVTLEYKDASGINSTVYTLRSAEDWASAGDVRAFVDWLVQTTGSDFTLPLPQAAASPV